MRYKSSVLWAKFKFRMWNAAEYEYSTSVLGGFMTALTSKLRQKGTKGYKVRGVQSRNGIFNKEKQVKW